jgi:CheY-like chemotaxis protein
MSRPSSGLATAGAAAVRVADMHRFDVILSDIGLPDGDGWTLMEEMRGKTQAYAIAMSGFGAAADVARSHAVGYQDHLTKPCTPHQLQQALKKAELTRSGTSQRIPLCP